MSDLPDPPLALLAASNWVHGVGHFAVVFAEWHVLKPIRPYLPVWPRLAFKAAVLLGGFVHCAAGTGDFALARWATVLRTPVFVLGSAAAVTLFLFLARAVLEQVRLREAAVEVAAAAEAARLGETPPELFVSPLAADFRRGQRQLAESIARLDGLIGGGRP
mgnify:FL=1